MALVLAHVADMAHRNGGKLGVLLAFAVAYRFRPMAVLGVGAIANEAVSGHASRILTRPKMVSWA